MSVQFDTEGSPPFKGPSDTPRLLVQEKGDMSQSLPLDTAFCPNPEGHVSGRKLCCLTLGGQTWGSASGLVTALRVLEGDLDGG